VGAHRVIRGLAHVHPLWIIPILAASYVGIVISCARWKVLLLAREIHTSVHRLVFYYIIGYFFSSFLPGMFGGDLVRSYVFGKKIKSQIESFASVFMERLAGLIGLVFVALIAAACNFHVLIEANLLPFMCIVFVGFALFLLAIFNRRLVERIGMLIRWRRIRKWKESFLKFHEAVYFFRSQKRVVIKAILYSILFQLFTSVNTYIVCLALGLNVPFLDIMLVLPIIFLICTVPSTPSATGVWEASFAIFFSKLGVPEADAVNIALVLRAKNIVVALLGGVFYIISGKELKKRTGTDES
jgi:uncharacterized protein (TIRG00374 family)